MSLSEHISTTILKRALNGLGCIHKYTHGIGHWQFVGLSDVLFLEALTIGTSKAIAASVNITTDNVIRCGCQELGQIF